MSLSAGQKAKLAAEVEAKARAFLADPATGRRAGYTPRLQPSPPVPLSGSPADEPMMQTASLYDWMRCVAEKDLRGHRWRVEPDVGGATLVIE